MNGFNAKFPRSIFIPKTAQHVDYVHFDLGMALSKCAIGKRGGKQSLSARPVEQSIWHEMAHACGLAHEQFHSNAYYRSIVSEKQAKGIQLAIRDELYANKLALNEYESYGAYDDQSIMLYAIFAAQDVRAETLSTGDIETIRFLFGIR